MPTIQQAIDDEKEHSRILSLFDIVAYEHETKDTYTAVAMSASEALEGVSIAYGPFVADDLMDTTLLARTVCGHIKRIYLEKFDVVRLRRRYGDMATETTNGPSVSW